MIGTFWVEGQFFWFFKNLNYSTVVLRFYDTNEMQNDIYFTNSSTLSTPCTMKDPSREIHYNL